MPEDFCPDCGDWGCSGCDGEGPPCDWCGEPGCAGYCNVDDYNLRGYDDWGGA